MKSTSHPVALDAQVGNYLVEVKTRVAALRTVRNGLLQLAYALADRPELKGVLVLSDVAVTPERLRHEWQLATSVLAHDMVDRLSIYYEQDEQLRGIPKEPDPKIQNDILNLLASVRRPETAHLRRPDYSFWVPVLLIHQWLLGRGPITTKWLMQTAGCSYPTVAVTLRRMADFIVRHSDRRVELRRFPKEEWERLVATSDKARGTIRYSDRSGQPRSAESLLRRLRNLNRKDTGIGGVIGAKQYYPNLDIVGASRLDVSLHCPGNVADLGFVERIDPGLKPVERRDEPASLVVHLLRRADPLFQTGKNGLASADPVECLFDLHEARLEPQAREFLASFPSAKGQL